MKKRIIAPIVAMAAVLTLSVSAAAVDSGATGVESGATNEEAKATVTVDADKDTEVELDNGIVATIEAGAFDGEVTLTVKPTATDNANNETAVAAIEKAIEDLKSDADGLTIVNKLEITVTDKDGKAIQPAEGKSVTITIPASVVGGANIVAYVGDNAVEFMELANNSFKTTHFSTFYLATVANAGDLAGKTSNPGTGVVLVAIPAAIIATAAVVVSKKRK